MNSKNKYSKWNAPLLRKRVKVNLLPKFLRSTSLSLYTGFFVNDYF